MRKRRPAAVIGLDAIGRLPLRIIVPITEWDVKYTRYPWIVHIKPNKRNRLSRESGADCFQLKSFSVERFIERIGTLDSADLDGIAAAIALCVGFDPH